MVVDVAERFGLKLLGRVNGTKHYAQTCELLVALRPGEVFFLDFGKVEYLTGSWINAMIAPLFRWAAIQCDLFPVLLNVADDWLDDFRMVAGWNHQCYLVATGVTLPPRRARLIGSLDTAQMATLQAVLECGEVTGAELQRQMTREKIRATAWNNRLKDLLDKRLLRRRKQGREQFYTAVVKEIKDDG